MEEEMVARDPVGCLPEPPPPPGSSVTRAPSPLALASGRSWYTCHDRRLSVFGSPYDPPHPTFPVW